MHACIQQNRRIRNKQNAPFAKLVQEEGRDDVGVVFGKVGAKEEHGCVASPVFRMDRNKKQ